MEDGLFPFLLLMGMLTSGGIGYWISGLRGRSGAEGFVLGAFVGPIGWIIVGLLSRGVGPTLVKPTAQTDSRMPALGDRKREPAAQHLSADGRQLRKCPSCAELVTEEAIVCKYCGENLAKHDELRALLRRLEEKNKSFDPGA
jgi:hypothetical protein